MLSDQVTQITFFKIYRHEGHGWTVYDSWGVKSVAAGQHRPCIREFAATGKIPDGSGTISIEEKRPERYLDVDADANADVQAYAFYLDANYDGKNRLEFISSKPFIFLPIHATFPSEVLEEFEAINPRCAYFVFDVKTARNSDLADRVADYAKPHRPALNIPFCFNLYDPELKAAPWLVSSYHAGKAVHSHGSQPHRHGEQADVGGAVPLTHGGVHPSTASFLSIDRPAEA